MNMRQIVEVLVSSNGATKHVATKAGDEGRWSVELPALKEGENLELTVTGKNAITLKNVIMGDIWLCSGQSNMSMPLMACPWDPPEHINFGAVEDAKKADFPKIRHLSINGRLSSDPVKDSPTLPNISNWQVCSPQLTGSHVFTAAGFYFAREVFGKTGVPIGIIDDAWSSSAIEPWIPREGVEAVPELKEAWDKRQKAIADYRLAKGRPPTIPPTIIPDLEGIAKENWCSIYNAMINPLIRIPIKGVLWYQGESNFQDPGDLYYHKMRALVNGWRKKWGQGDFPFYYVQLASMYGVNDNPEVDWGYGLIRPVQLKTMAIPNTGMAVAIDIGEAENIHPRDKLDVGLRLARWALNRDCGQKDLVPSGPLFKEMKIEGDKARISFDYVGSGLMVGFKDGSTLEGALAPTVEDKKSKLKRFAIAGEDKKWHWADAVTDGNTVVVSSPDVKKPVAVRYAMSSNPKGANLYNREGLPASPFRTDNW